MAGHQNLPSISVILCLGRLAKLLDLDDELAWLLLHFLPHSIVIELNAAR